MDIFNVCKLGFGTSQIGGPALINGELIGANPIPKKDAINILKYAYDNGINFFDTSDKYGDAEDFLGEAFSAMRNEVVIATKCGLTSRGGRDFSLPYINSCMENSLKRLNTDYIDIFQLAKPGIEDVSDEIISFMEKNIKEGKVRHFGISVTGNDDGRVYLSRKTIESFQIFYNLIFTENHKLIEHCARNQKFIIVRSPLNSGILSGKYTIDTKFDQVDSRSKVFQGPLLKERLECVEKIRNRFNLTSDEVLSFSLNFIFSDTNVNVVIPAASKIEQLENYLNIFNKTKRFDKAALEEIIDFSQREFCHHRGCQFK